MARKSSTIVVPVTVTAGGKVTLADLKVLRETHKVAIKGLRTLDNVQQQVEAAGLTLQVNLTDNASKTLSEGKELGLLRTQRPTPKAKGKKGKKGGKATTAAPKAKGKDLVEFVKNDGTTVLCTPGQAAAWSKFRANAPKATVKQAVAPEGKAKVAEVSDMSEATIAAIAAVVIKALAAQQ